MGDISLGLSDQIIVSPDGSRFAVTGTVEGERALYWRSASEESFRVVPGTEGARGATFSPEGDRIAYGTVEGALFKVSLSGGAPVPLVRAGSVSQGVYVPHWGDDGTIVFTSPSGLFRVPDTGGQYVLIDESGQFVNSHLLPDGWAVLGDRISGGLVLLDLTADSIRELNPVGFDPKYVETGHILYVDGSGGLWALPFDAANGDVLGDAVPILDGVSTAATGAFRFPRYSVSRNGTLVYGTGTSAVDARRLLIVDLEGNPEPVGLSPRVFGDVRWSPDGRSVVYRSLGGDASAFQIYTYDLEVETTPRPLTSEGDNRAPVFSPDGSRVAFMSLREGTDGYDLFVKTLDDDEPARSIITFPINQVPVQWPSDTLVVFENSPGVTGAADLWVLDLSDPDSAVAVEYLSSEANLRDIMVSPDGTLAAYTSDVTGTNEVYIRSFPEPGERTPVSQGGGEYPFWSPDGNTVFYWSVPGAVLGESTFMAATVRRDPTPVVQRRDSLFTGTYVRSGWSLHPDGDQLVVPQAVLAGQEGVDSENERFVVVVNWFEELRQRMEN